MVKFRTGVAIAALMITTSAAACTDWRAIATFDQTYVASAQADWLSSHSKVTGDIYDQARDAMFNDRAAAMKDECGNK